MGRMVLSALPSAAIRGDVGFAGRCSDRVIEHALDGLCRQARPVVADCNPRWIDRNADFRRHAGFTSQASSELSANSLSTTSGQSSRLWPVWLVSSFGAKSP